MTFVWIFIWIIFSLIILGAFFWSLLIQLKQKKAWEAFANKFGLQFIKGTLAGPCAVEGNYDGYDISLFTAEQQNIDSRKNRKVTGLQINAQEGFVDALAAGSPDMRGFIKTLDGVARHKTQGDLGFNKSYILHSRNPSAVDLFLTPERVAVIEKMLGVSNANVILLMDENEGAYRIETSNPLSDLGQLEKMVKTTINRYKKLSVTPGEQKAFKSAIKDAENGDDMDENEPEESVSREKSPKNDVKSKAKKAVKKSAQKSTKKKTASKKPENDSD